MSRINKIGFECMKIEGDSESAQRNWIPWTAQWRGAMLFSVAKGQT